MAVVPIPLHDVLRCARCGSTAGPFGPSDETPPRLVCEDCDTQYCTPQKPELNR